jgi:hypothetical protein
VGQRGQAKLVDYILFYEKGNKNYQMGKGVFVQDEQVSAVKSVELISDTVSCIDLRGLWCKIIILSVHILTEEKNNDSNTVLLRTRASFIHFLMYHTKILL